MARREFGEAAASEVALWLANDEAAHERWVEQAARTLARFKGLDDEAEQRLLATATLAEMMEAELGRVEVVDMPTSLLAIAFGFCDWRAVAEVFVITAQDYEAHGKG